MRIYMMNDSARSTAEVGTDELVLQAIYTFCYFSILVRIQNHTALSLMALNDVLGLFYHRWGDFQEKTMCNSVKAKVYG